MVVHATLLHAARFCTPGRCSDSRCGRPTGQPNPGSLNWSGALANPISTRTVNTSSHLHAHGHASTTHTSCTSFPSISMFAGVLQPILLKMDWMPTLRAFTVFMAASYFFSYCSTTHVAASQNWKERGSRKLLLPPHPIPTRTDRPCARAGECGFQMSPAQPHRYLTAHQPLEHMLRLPSLPHT